MLQSLPGEKSANFAGTIGQTISANYFPKENYLIDDSRFDSEGDWAFCRFFGDEVYAARLGFLRGAYDFSDYGGIHPPTESFLQLHLEFMTREGAILWLPTRRFKAEQVVIDSEKMDNRLLVGDTEIFRIRGWPNMRWDFRSDDDEMEAHLAFELVTTTILPDNFLPNNLFAMWASVGRVNGSVRYRHQTDNVSGFVFYDHPRLNIQRNNAAPLQYYLYCPMYFDDESTLICYYAVDSDGTRRDYYSFGLYVDPKGRAQWLPRTSLSDLTLDTDDLPKRWNLKWVSPSLDLDVDVAVKSTSILKVWGAPNLPQTRKELVYIPLVLDSEGSIRKNKVEKPIRGFGLAEYWRMPEV